MVLKLNESSTRRQTKDGKQPSHTYLVIHFIKPNINIFVNTVNTPILSISIICQDFLV